MKSILLAGAALCALTVVANAADPLAAGAARPEFSGHVEVYGQGAWQDYWDDYYSPWTGLGGAARVNWWYSPDWSAQFDVAAQSAASTYDPEYTSHSLYGAVHLSKRSDSHLLGVFGGLSSTSDYEGNYGTDIGFFGGVEAQSYMGPVTLYVQGGLAHQLTGYYGGSASDGYGPEWNFNYAFGQIEARYFVNPNTKISANLGIVSGDSYGSEEVSSTWLSYGVEIEHRFDAKPFSIFARAQGFKGSGYYDVTGYRVMAGVKFNFDSSSLLDQDRNGATLKVMEDLAPIGDLRGFE